MLIDRRSRRAIRLVYKGEFKRLPSYRLYRLDGAGKIATGEWIEAPHDEDAVRLANDRAAEGRHELWDGRRLVAKIRKDPP